jgi:protein-tyrosine phosphatase
MSPRHFTVLFVCTGNICRSAYAASLASNVIPAANVVSAGTRAAVDCHAPDELVQVAAARGLDMTAHRGRQLTRDDVERADLVLGLAREHRSAALRLHPRSSRYAFSLLEFARLAEGAELGATTSDEPFDPGRARDAVAEIASRRGTLVPPLHPSADDVPDPFRRGRAAYESAAAAIDPAIQRLTAALHLFSTSSNGSIS